MLLASCALPTSKAPASRVEVPAGFQEQPRGGAPVTAVQLKQWWQAWQDPLLDRLIEQALQTNTDVRSAQERVAEARSMVTVVESALYPTVAASGGIWGGAADWHVPALLSSVEPGMHGYWEGLGASWEPDVFGARHADAAAARAVSLSIQERLAGTRITVAADVAENYHEARGLQRRLQVLDEGIAALEELLRYARARYESGQALSYDVDRVREQLDAERAKRPVLASLLEMRRRRIAVLTGRAPEDAPVLAPPGPFSVPAPPTGLLPAEVLARRPDVQARAALVEADAARLKSAKADLLPRFAIDFLGGNGEIKLDGLPSIGGTGGLASLSAYLPIFTAGRIRANIAATDARLEAAAADYDGAVLQALADVENAYRLRTALDQRSTSLQAALTGARRNQQASIALYEAGRKTLQDVLDARLAALQEQDDLVQNEMGRATATVQLYRALGGGW